MSVRSQKTTASVREKMRKVLDSKSKARHDAMQGIISDDSDSESSIESVLSKTSNMSNKRRAELDGISRGSSIRKPTSSGGSVSSKASSRVNDSGDDDDSDDKIRDMEIDDDTIERGTKDLIKFREAAKIWVKADMKIREISVKKQEILDFIKEQEAIKKQHEPIIQKYLNTTGKEDFNINDGSKIVTTIKKQTETFSAKTIPKYMEEVFTAINNEDLDFIEEKLMPIYDTKMYPDMDWDKVPGKPQDYLDMLLDDPKFLSRISCLYAHKSRTCEETEVIKRTSAGAKTRGRPKK